VRIRGLDLLRGIAVGLVILRHAFPDTLAGAGVVGVVMFFALSGHLITGLLLGELQRTGSVDLRRFYVRRARRLVPALLFLVAGVALVTLLLDPLGDRSSLGRDVVAALTWTGNLPHLTPSGATFHLWTLATEEQFYLVWPALLVLAFRRRLVLVLLVAATAACLVAAVLTVLWLHAEPDLAYALPTSWAVCFVIGAASRILAPLVVVPPWAPGAALAGLALLSVIPLRGHALTYLVAAPAVAVLTAVLLVAWRDWADVSSALLRPVVALGTISYGAYLWNYPLTLWLRPHLDHAGVLAAVLTVPMALLSRHLVEKRFQAPARETVRV
jgi:peptidoglycan/LPS O-acetylase OafA/YrhL